MLKRYRAIIDLEASILVIDNHRIRFLPEAELPNRATQKVAPELAIEAQQPLKDLTAGQGVRLGPAADSLQSGVASSSNHPEVHVQQLMDLGVSREQAIQALEAANGDVQVESVSFLIMFRLLQTSYFRVNGFSGKTSCKSKG